MIVEFEFFGVVIVVERYFLGCVYILFCVEWRLI